MNDYESLVEGYEGLGSPADDPGPLSDEETQRMLDTLVTADTIEPPGELDEPPPFEDGDGFDEPSTATELRALKSFEVAVTGVHYVIYEGAPRAVVKSYPHSEDAYVSANLSSLPNPREDRARRYLQVRYRGYLCGDVATL